MGELIYIFFNTKLNSRALTDSPVNFSVATMLAEPDSAFVAFLLKNRGKVLVSEGH